MCRWLHLHLTFWLPTNIFHILEYIYYSWNPYFTREAFDTVLSSDIIIGHQKTCYQKAAPFWRVQKMSVPMEHFVFEHILTKSDKWNMGLVQSWRLTYWKRSFEQLDDKPLKEPCLIYIYIYIYIYIRPPSRKNPWNNLISTRLIDATKTI